MPARWDKMFEKIRASVPEIKAGAAWARLRSGDDVFILDVREKEEVEQGHVEGAILIPRGLLEMRVEAAVPDKALPVMVYCASGVRSVMACESLRQLGFTDVASVEGGFRAWKSAGLPFLVPHSDDRMSRYMRHIRIPEVGEKGQRKLLESKVLMIGAGGLGSPSAMYLAAAGVGRLGLVDSDNVDYTNLQRQLLHKTRNVGMPKVQSARETLYDINPDVKVDMHHTRLTRDNAEEIIPRYDLVVDGCDNFETRYLVNDVCVKHRIPNMYASIFRFDGQATVFLPGDGPCYRCLYPEPTPTDLAPSCEEAGVLGVLPGTLGVIQATEALKVLLGIGRPLNGRLLYYDALDESFREFKVERNPSCAACGDNADVDHLIATFEVTSGCAARAGAGGQGLS